MSEQRNITGQVIKGLLIDIDGVLMIENRRIEGSVEAIQYLKENDIPFLLVTNTTRKSRFGLLSNLRRQGFAVETDQVFPAAFAAAQWLKERKIKRIYLLLRGDAYREFTGFKVTANNPEYLIIGDIGEDLTYDKLNHAFRLVMNGTRMLALQKNRFWQRKDGLSIDAGPLIAALEYATGKRAAIIGKPKPEFFKEALKILNLKAEETAMVGDDLEADIGGAARVGLYTVAVKTGKFREEQLKKVKTKPQLLLSSIADLPEWIEKISSGGAKK